MAEIKKFSSKVEFDNELKITSDREILDRILPCLISKQTPDEVQNWETYHKNHQGLNSGDARLFTSVWERRHEKFAIKYEEIRQLRERLSKYWRQV